MLLVSLFNICFFVAVTYGVSSRFTEKLFEFVGK